MRLGNKTRALIISAFFVPILVVLILLFSPFANAKTSIIELSDSCPQLNDIDHDKIHSSKVKWLPDGDTLHTEDGLKIRLLHINTPEINPKSALSTESIALKAKSRLRQLIGSEKSIYWTRDQRRKDQYGRILAFVFNQQGLLLNSQLVKEGLAHPLVIPPNQLYWSCFAESRKQAQNHKRGIWSNPKIFNTSRQIIAENGWQLVTGKITHIKNTKKYRWLVLDDILWIGVPVKNFHYFSTKTLDFSIGENLSLRGYAYRSYGKLRMKLSHPAMIIR